MKKLILLLPLLGACQVTDSEKQLANAVAIAECQRIKNVTNQALCLQAAGVAADEIQRYVNSLSTRKP